MIKMVAFDLDGTICDSIPLCIEAFMKAVMHYADHELTEKDIVSTFGLNEIGMVKAVVKNDWENALNDFYNYYEELHDMCAEPFEGIYELIVFLKQKRIIVPLITGKGERSCKITLEKIGMDNLFDELMFGSEKHPNKKESMSLLLSKYSIEKDEFLYIGDTLSDVEACNSMGVTCLSAAWDEKNNPLKLKAKNPLHVYESVSELSRFLKEYI